MNNYFAYSISWNKMYSNINSVVSYDVFKEKMKETLLPLDDPDMEQLFKLITRSKGNNRFKWGSQATIIGNVENVLLDLIREYKMIKEFWTNNESYKDINIQNTFSKLFGLPADNSLIDDDTISKTNQFVQTSTGNVKKLDGFDTISNIINMKKGYEDLLKKTNKLFTQFQPSPETEFIYTQL